MDYSAKHQFLQSLLGHGSFSSSSKECAFFCPFCPTRHHKPKLYVNLDTDFYQCFVCGAGSRSLIPIIRKLGSKQDFNEYIEKYKAKSVKIGKKSEEFANFKLDLPKEFFPIFPNKDNFLFQKSYNYLVNVRKISDDTILKHKIGTAFSGEYANRIIFPSFDHRGLVNFFTSRTYEGQYWSPEVPKGYRFSVIMNELNLDFTKPITLVEGFGDLYKANENASPLLGSYLPEESSLFRSIVMNNTPVYLSLDPDAKEKSNKIAKSFMKYDIPVYNVEVKPYKDIGEMSNEEFMSRYNNATIVSSSIILREKIKSL